MASTMKAALFHEHGGPEVIEAGEVPVPEPGPGQVRVAVRAASLNHLDLFVRKGGLPLEIPKPHIGGADAAGVVDRVGAGVEGIQEGTPVVVDPSLHYDAYFDTPPGPDLPAPEFQIVGEHLPGGLAEYICVPAENLLQIPDTVTFSTAAAAGLVSVTAWRGLFTRGGLRAGERVLVTGGSGGVATMAVQMAQLAGAEVFAVTSGPENVERVRELGAHHVHDRLEEDFSRAVWDATGRRGVHLVLDSAGEAVLPAALRSLAPQGRLVTYGATTGPALEADVRLIFWKQLSVVGSTMGTPTEFRRAMELVFGGRIRPVIQHELSLEETRRGHELLEAGDVFGKIVVRP